MQAIKQQIIITFYCLNSFFFYIFSIAHCIDLVNLRVIKGIMTQTKNNENKNISQIAHLMVPIYYVLCPNNKKTNQYFFFLFIANVSDVCASDWDAPHANFKAFSFLLNKTLLECRSKAYNSNWMRPKWSIDRSHRRLMSFKNSVVIVRREQKNLARRPFDKWQCRKP